MYSFNLTVERKKGKNFPFIEKILKKVHENSPKNNDGQL